MTLREEEDNGTWKKKH